MDDDLLVFLPPAPQETTSTLRTIETLVRDRALHEQRRYHPTATLACNGQAQAT